MRTKTNESFTFGILGEKILLERLLVRRDLIIHPIIDLQRQLGPASIDVRLGTRFYSQRTSSLVQIDPLATEQQIELEILKATDFYMIDPTEPYILHANDFVLASTFEYVMVPLDLMARLEGRSSWARKGLQVHATAGFIDPGFEGYITFELSNVSNMPIALYPTLRIGQISFYSLGSETVLPYGKKHLSKYQGDLGPSWTRIHKDPEWDIIKRQQVAQDIGYQEWTKPAASFWNHVDDY
jgi:dCTP deaminase